MRTLLTLLKKEGLQIVRDPSTLLIAFALPLMLLFIFGYGVNLDSSKMRIGLVVKSNSPDATSLVAAFNQSPFLDVSTGRDLQDFEADLVGGHLRGIITIPNSFSVESLVRGDGEGIQVIADGSEPNTASFVQNYAQGVFQSWLALRISERGGAGISTPTPTTITIQVEPRFWYNPELKSRNFLLPGSMVIILTLVGTLLTALVVAREWERGTMEALLATPVSSIQLLLSKLIAYFILGLGSMIVCWLAIVLIFHVPFRGSFAALLLTTSVFLFGALGQGLLISTIAKNQFIAAQAAVMSGFLPSFMLSGFIFEISSMPQPIQWITYLFPARYYVTSVQTLFLVGNVWAVLISAMIPMGIIGLVLFALTVKKTKKRLDI